MKKIALLVLSAVTVICLLLGLTACQHEHEFEWETVTPATCFHAGERRGTCSCGEVVTETIEQLSGHDGSHTEQVTVPVTCTTDGEVTVTCSICNDSVTQTLVSNGHSWGEWSNIQDPTCVRTGTDKRVCTVCGEEETREAEMIAHSWGDWTTTKPATCTEQGVRERRCDVCGTSQTDNTALAEHQLGALVAKVEPTCADGLEAHYECTVCHQCFVETDGVKQFVDRELLVIPGNGQHVFGATVPEQLPTCDKDGVREHKVCSVCRKNYDANGVAIDDVTLPATGHLWARESYITVPDCTHSGIEKQVCSICNAGRQVNVDKTPHIPQTIPQVNATCTQPGKTESVECSVCHTVLTPSSEIPATQHNWGEWQPFEEPTEDSDGKNIRNCSVCGAAEYQDIPSKDHVWGPWQDLGNGWHERTCQTDASHTQKELCSYGENGTTHSATCTEAGYTEYECIVCRHVNKVEGDAALGHIYGSWISEIVDEKADGHTHTHYRDCTRCNAPEARQRNTCELKSISKEEVTCTTPGYERFQCEQCRSIHEVVTEQATGHTYEYEQDKSHRTHRQKCTKCGLTTDYKNCTLVDTPEKATCDKPLTHNYQCSVCGLVLRITEGNALGHSLQAPEFSGVNSNGKNQHTEKCSRCEYEVVTECTIVESSKAPTCTEAGSVTKVCQFCLHSEQSTGAQSAGHSWLNDGVYKPTGDGNHMRKCGKCGFEDIQQCNYDVVPTAATCTDKPYDTKTCSECGDSVRVITGEALGHSWKVEYINENGHKSVCNTCATIDEGAHDWSQSNLCSSCGYDGLNYKVLGAHCLVENDNRILSAKNIVIPAQHPILGDNGKYTGQELPVLGISKWAFMNNHTIQTVSIPDTVETIEEYAFYFCTDLQELHFEGAENHLKTIGMSAFMGCKLLTTFEAPTSLTQLGASAFGMCTALRNITIPNQLEDIGSRAFEGTAYIEQETNWSGNMIYLGKHLLKARAGDGTDLSLEVREDTVTIAANAFAKIKNLVSVKLHKGLKVIDKDAFLECENIANVEFVGTLHDWLNIRFENDYSSPLCYNASMHIDGATGMIDLSDTQITRIPSGTFKGTAITGIRLPETVTYIGEDAFADCDQLTSVNLPDAITYIGKDAFTNSKYYNTASNWGDDGVLYIDNHLIKVDAAKATGTITIKSTVRTICIEAFKGCANVTSVYIPASVVRIGAYAFDGCNALTGVKFATNNGHWLCNIPGVIGRGNITDGKTPQQCLDLLRSYRGEWTKY